MPRKLRVQYPGAIYHVMNRGHRQEYIFLVDVDRQDFLKTLAVACQKTDYQIHAWTTNWASTILENCAGKTPKPKPSELSRRKWTVWAGKTAP